MREPRRAPHYTQPRGRSGRDGARIRAAVTAVAAAAVKYELFDGCQIDLAVKILFIFFHKDAHTFTAPPPSPIGAGRGDLPGNLQPRS